MDGSADLGNDRQESRAVMQQHMKRGKPSQAFNELQSFAGAVGHCRFRGRELALPAGGPTFACTG